MKIDVKVKNLGKIKEAEFKVRPMTVITGENSTGKSFFTKSLYSILNVINKNVYHEAISQVIRQIQLQLETFVNSFSYISQDDGYYRDSIIFSVEKLQHDLNDASGWKINEYFALTAVKANDVKIIFSQYKSYLSQLKNKTKFKAVSDLALAVEKNLESLIDYLNDANKTYSRLFSLQIENELKDNFQISNLSELISFNEKRTEINVENTFLLEVSQVKMNFKLDNDFIDKISCLSNVVFFESPAYWKVREALKAAKSPSYRWLIRNENALTGVPKYFYDLDSALNTKVKTGSVFENIINSLEKEIGGEFVFKDDNLSFKDNESGKQISKNLMSFGMTNLGMIQALLKHNIITKGSFVFIDEPETNLHPTWQVVLMNVLLELASAGVNIVITTHSTDILKALEVNIKKRQIDSMNDFLSVHFVEDGKLLKFDSDNSGKQLIEARELLNSAYEELYFSDL